VHAGCDRVSLPALPARVILLHPEWRGGAGESVANFSATGLDERCDRLLGMIGCIRVRGYARAGGARCAAPAAGPRLAAVGGW